MAIGFWPSQTVFWMPWYTGEMTNRADKGSQTSSSGRLLPWGMGARTDDEIGSLMDFII